MARGGGGGEGALHGTQVTELHVHRTVIPQPTKGWGAAGPPRLTSLFPCRTSHPTCPTGCTCRQREMSFCSLTSGLS